MGERIVVGLGDWAGGWDGMGWADLRGAIWPIRDVTSFPESSIHDRGVAPARPPGQKGRKQMLQGWHGNYG